MIEYEKKILLSAEEYFALVIMFGERAPVVTQTNYYFDSEDLSMNEIGITCRIRAKNRKFTTSIKNHNIGRLNGSIEEIICEKKHFSYKIFEIMGLILQGELNTKRIILYKDDFCEIDLDRNTYLGVTDFELEAEYLEGYETKALVQLNKIAEALVDSSIITGKKEFLTRASKVKSKSQRFFELKEKLNHKPFYYT